MKKTILKVSMAAMLLSQMVLVGGVEGKAVNTVVPRVATTVTADKAAVPVMTDNLFKYGLKKDVELPVTLSLEGLSYTLHKVMIYDINSKDAKNLIKKYEYFMDTGFGVPKYFIWTKITITNKTGRVVQRNFKDLNDKWIIYFESNVPSGAPSGDATPAFPGVSRAITNSKEALNTFVLRPGESLTTYEGFSYGGNFKEMSIRLDYAGKFKDFYIANKPEDAQ